MEKAKISTIQLFAMMFMFDMGSALVVSYGITAKKDAWLAILLGMCGGIVLFFTYYFLFRKYPHVTLIGYLKETIGTYAGWLIGLLYMILFMYIAARNIREFSEMLTSSTLTYTPLLALIIPLVLVMCYVLYLGIEVVGRTAEVFIVILVFFGITGNFLIIISGNIDFHHLRPFLEHGWKPVLTTAFPLILTFPFGEMIVFTMLLPYVNEGKAVKKVWLSALVVSGFVLSWTVGLNIAVLGVNMMERATFPTLATVGMVNLLSFIQRLDAIVVFTLLITIFFKASIYLYGAVIGIADLFKLKNHQQVLLPSGIILIFIAITNSSNFSEHLKEGLDVAVYYLYFPFFVIIPMVILMVAMIRNRFKKTKNEKTG